MTVLLLLMALPVTRLALGSTSEMLSTLGDLLIWGGNETSNVTTKIILILPV